MSHYLSVLQPDKYYRLSKKIQKYYERFGKGMPWGLYMQEWHKVVEESEEKTINETE